jgi:hypothetical protein
MGGLRWIRCVLACILVLLAACGSMPVTSLIKLAQIDFASTDPRQLRMAIKLPRAIRPQPQGVTLRIGVKLANGEEQFQDFVVREVTDPKDVLALHGELDADTQVFAYRLDAEEVARVNAFRDELKRKQAESGGRGGALTIAIRPQACRTAELPPRPVLATTYLQTAETGSYVPLARDVDLRTIDPRQDVVGAIPMCT